MNRGGHTSRSPCDLRAHERSFPRSRALAQLSLGIIGSMSLLGQMQAAWSLAEARLATYRLVCPGEPSFRCLASECPTNCCVPYTVALSAEDLDRLVRVTRRPVRELVECEGEEPVVLPLAEPYVLAREGGRCRFLGADGLCTVYEGRPNACRLYPFQVVFVERESGKPRAGTPRLVSRARDLFTSGTADEHEPVLPLLLRHAACPGMVGPPLDVGEWRRLALQVLELQYRAQAVPAP